jgi:hypothetical protein
MRKLAQVLVVLAIPVLLAGCSIHGKWALRDVNPDAARRDFKYEVLTLQNDGSFYAEAKEPSTTTTSGTYTFSDAKHELVLKEHDGDVRSYDARFESATRLRLTDTSTDKKIVARFDRKQ